MNPRYDVIVIGGGHAGVEAAWAAANALSGNGQARPGCVALVTQDPSKIGVMSCNPANGGLAKGQIVREIDALGGLMALATDAAGIQFKVLNTSKGAAVRGPRAQCDKHAYARAVQAMIASRPEITVIAGTVEQLVLEKGAVAGAIVSHAGPAYSAVPRDVAGATTALSCTAVVLTTGTFMRALMHTGEQRTKGGRVGEASAVGISHDLRRLGFELGRLKTGTPPRLKRGTIDWDALEPQRGDEPPVPFSDLSSPHTPPTPDAANTLQTPVGPASATKPRADQSPFPSLNRFPVLPQIDCRITSTTAAVHDAIRANLHRAPMYSGQIESTGPRYCPSIEDKVVRFADKPSHHVYLEPESLDDDWVYANGISTSLPKDVQDVIVRSMPGCEHAHIYRYGYAVEYDMVRPHQLSPTTQTKLVRGLFLAGQINGTSGYEEAAAQGVVAGINAARWARGEDLVTIERHQGYIGVLLDDLATKTPVEPYRMFTSRAEHRLLLRADNAADRLTPLAIDLGLLRGHELGRLRTERFNARRASLAEINRRIDTARIGDKPLADALRNPEFTTCALAALIGHGHDRSALLTAHTDRFYEPYQRKAASAIKHQADLDRKRIPPGLLDGPLQHLRAEAKAAVQRFRPETLGQASRLEGITPADVTLLGVLIRKHRLDAGGS